MTKIRGGLFSITAAGRLGSKLIYQTIHGISRVKKYAYSRRAPTIYQYFHRIEYAIAFIDWQTSKNKIKNRFKKEAKEKPVTGWNLFLKYRFKHIGCRAFNEAQFGVTRLCAEGG